MASRSKQKFQKKTSSSSSEEEEEAVVITPRPKSRAEGVKTLKPVTGIKPSSKSKSEVPPIHKVVPKTKPAPQPEEDSESEEDVPVKVVGKTKPKEDVSVKVVGKTKPEEDVPAKVVGKTKPPPKQEESSSEEDVSAKVVPKSKIKPKKSSSSSEDDSYAPMTPYIPKKISTPKPGVPKTNPLEEKKERPSSPLVSGEIPPGIMEKIFEFAGVSSQIRLVFSAKQIQDLLNVKTMDLYDTPLTFREFQVLTDKYPGMKFTGFSLNFLSMKDLPLLRKWFPNIKHMKLHFYATLSDLSFLQDCSRLQELVLVSPIESIRGLSAATNLKRLSLQVYSPVDTEIKVDFAEISQLSNLEFLSLINGSGLQRSHTLTPNLYLDGLKNMPHLREVLLDNFDIEEKKAFSGCPNLLKLAILESNMANLNFLSLDYQLQELSIETPDDNDLQEIKAISLQKELLTFSFVTSSSGTPSSIFSPLANCLKLRSVTIGGLNSTVAFDFRFLELLPRLETLIIRSPLNDTKPISKCYSLTTLVLKSQNYILVEVFLPQPRGNHTGLINLDLDKCHVTHHTLKAIGTNTQLRKLTINFRKGHGISNCDDLKRLNQLEELDLTIIDTLNDFKFLEGMTNLRKLTLDYFSGDFTSLKNNTLLTSLTVQHTNAKSLKGLEYLTALEKLLFDNLIISDVSALSKAHNLKEIVLINVRFLESFILTEDLPHLTKIIILARPGTKYTLKHIGGFEHCPNLESFRLDRAIIKEIDTLQHCPELNVLELSNLAKLTDITALRECKQLKKVVFSEMDSLQDVSPLAGCPELEEIKLSNFKLSFEILPLAGLKNLAHLFIGDFRQVPDLRDFAKVAPPNLLLYNDSVRKVVRAGDFKELSYLAN